MSSFFQSKTYVRITQPLRVQLRYTCVVLIMFEPNSASIDLISTHMVIQALEGRIINRYNFVFVERL